MYCDWPHLGRCCFCMPLRRGVLTCAYIYIFFSAFMIGLYCYAVHYAMMGELLLIGRSLGRMPAEVCLVFYCLELIFDAILIYGAHMKLLKYVKAFFYYTVVTYVALFIVQIVDISYSSEHAIVEKSIFSFAGLCIQLYMITLVRSLIHDMELSGPHTYENQLHPIANPEVDVKSNGIYNDTTVVPIDV